MSNEISAADATAYLAARAKAIANFQGAPSGQLKSNDLTNVPFTDVLESARVDSADSTNAADSAATADVVATNDETEDRFLTLLVAQMRNQDPMNPLENAEVTTQLAQINTVRGIESLGSTMKQLLERFDQTSPVESADMLNRQILVQSDLLNVEHGIDESVIGGAYLQASTGGVTAQIFGPDGSEVRRIDLGAQPSGVATFEWDGTDSNGDAVEPGRYQLQVVGISDGEAVELTPLAGARVTGVTRGDEMISYRVEGGANVPADDVLGVF